MTPKENRPILTLKKKHTPQKLNIVDGKIVLNKPKASKSQENTMPTKPYDGETGLEFNARQKKAAKALRQKLLKGIVETLTKSYPDIFDKAHPKPLAIGIHKQIRAKHPNISRKLTEITMRRWTSTKKYRAVLIPGADRYNLDGSVSDQVTQSQIKHKSS